MSEITALFKNFEHDPLAQIVLGVIVLLKVIDLLIKYVPQIFGKKKTTVEQLLEIEAEAQKAWRASVDSKVSEIEKEIKSLVLIITDHKELLGPVSQGTLENMLFNEDTPIFRRLKAYLRLLAMDVNGRIKIKGWALVLENKETWLDVLETMPKLKLKIVNKAHFDAVMKEINDNIFSGMMW